MTNNSNRIVAGMEEWKQKEAQMKKSFGEDVSGKRHFDREKLRYYEKLSEIKPVNSDEKFARRILKGEIKTLEKKAYPNRWVRLLRNTGKALSNGIKNLYRKIPGPNTESSKTRGRVNSVKDKINGTGKSQKEKEYKKRSRQVVRSTNGVGDRLLPKFRQGTGRSIKR